MRIWSCKLLTIHGITRCHPGGKPITADYWSDEITYEVMVDG